MGNIRGIEVLKRGSRIGAAGNEKIVEAGKKNGDIFNSEEGIPDATSQKNMRVLMETAREYSGY